jgi:hypothetical protein
MLPACTLFKIQHSFPISLSHLGRGTDEGVNSNSCNMTSMDCVTEYLYQKSKLVAEKLEGLYGPPKAINIP